jgi:hypothetical protein
VVHNTATSNAKAPPSPAASAPPTRGRTSPSNGKTRFDTGVVGPLWTIGGATLQVQPATLSLPGQSPWITAQIEVADQGAAAIALRTLAFSVDGVPGVIPCGFRPPTCLKDLDGDGNVDLEVRFHAALLRHVLRRTPSGPVLLRAS